MSAPHTDIEKQRRRHKGPLIGMALVVVFAVALIFFWWGELASKTEPRTPNDVTTIQQADPSVEVPVPPAPDQPAAN